MGTHLQPSDIRMDAEAVRALKTELLQLARTNFSESFQILVHLKVIRLFVESVLRYGLPADYIGIVVKVSYRENDPDIKLKASSFRISPKPKTPRKCLMCYKPSSPT